MFAAGDSVAAGEDAAVGVADGEALGSAPSALTQPIANSAKQTRIAFISDDYIVRDE
jgi:hypothetical protein